MYSMNAACRHRLKFGQLILITYAVHTQSPTLNGFLLGTQRNSFCSNFTLKIIFTIHNYTQLRLFSYSSVEFHGLVFAAMLYLLLF
jgi:hypothetical protein